MKESIEKEAQKHLEYDKRASEGIMERMKRIMEICNEWDNFKLEDEKALELIREQTEVKSGK